jgi:ADP-ribose pyrophosphatase
MNDMNPTPDAPAMSSGDVEVVSQEIAYRGAFEVIRFWLRHRLFRGEWSEVMLREVFERGHAVAVLLYDPDMDTVILLEQFRIGALTARGSPGYDADSSPWLVEIVAGIVEPGELPEEVARRESREEAGCMIRELTPIMRFILTPGVSSETICLFLAIVDSSSAGGIHGLTGENEDIRVSVVAAPEVFHWLDQGRVCNATAIIALQWLRMNHQQLRARRRAA